MCCSVNSVSLRFDPASLSETVLGFDLSNPNLPTLIATRGKKVYSAELKYVFNNVEYLAEVRQSIKGGPTKPGDPLPDDAKIVLDLTEKTEDNAGGKAKSSGKSKA